MASPFTRSPSATTAESDTLTRFLEAVQDLWPGATIQLPTPRMARLIAQHDAWLKTRQTDGVSWFDIITSCMDETWHGDAAADECIWDHDPDDAT
jgi:hypothetical protein